MTPKNDMWMPLFVADYLSATTHLHGAEHGAYLLLIMHAWKNGGRIPGGDAQLSRIARLNAREWRAAKPVVLAFWTPDGDGFTHGRINAELVRAARNVEQRSAAGKASAESRKRQREGNVRSTDDATNAQRNGRPSPSPTSVPNGTGAEAPIDAEKKAWADGVSLLVSAGKMSNAGARAFLGRLKSEHGIEAKDLLPAIGQAIANGTQDPAGYLRKAAEGVSKRRSGGSAAAAPGDETINWRVRADAWKRDRTWLGSWGPTPDERGCQCPDALLGAV